MHFLMDFAEPGFTAYGYFFADTSSKIKLLTV